MSQFHYWVACESSGNIPCVKSAVAEGCPMPDAYLNGRPVYFGDVYHGSEPGESYFESASYADDDSELSDKELDTLTEAHCEYLAEEFYEWYAGKAEAWADRDR